MKGHHLSMTHVTPRSRHSHMWTRPAARAAPGSLREATGTQLRLQSPRRETMTPQEPQEHAMPGQRGAPPTPRRTVGGIPAMPRPPAVSPRLLFICLPFVVALAVLAGWAEAGAFAGEPVRSASAALRGRRHLPPRVPSRIWCKTCAQARGTTDVGARAWLAMKTCVAGTRADIPTLDGRCHQVEIVPQLVSRRRTANLPPSSPVSWPNLRDHLWIARSSQVWHRGRLRARGVSVRRSSCAPNPTITKSDPRLLLAAVRASDPQFSEQVESVCTTCDPMLMDTPSAMRSKFDCLQRHWSDPTMATPTLRAELGGRMRAMVALADHLTPPSARPHANISVMPRVKQRSRVNLRLRSRCRPRVRRTLPTRSGVIWNSARLATVHTPGYGPAAWVAADECIAVLDRVTRAHDATSGARLRRCRARHKRGRSCSTSYAAPWRRLRPGLGEAAASETNNDRYPELERTLVLMDRWYKAERRSLEAARTADVDAAATAALNEVTGAFWAAAHQTRRTVDLEALFASGTPPSRRSQPRSN